MVFGGGLGIAIDLSRASHRSHDLWGRGLEIWLAAQFGEYPFPGIRRPDELHVASRLLEIKPTCFFLNFLSHLKFSLIEAFDNRDTI
ncbi:hypothetical protein TNCV_3786591 [Trichonephila clavipes]|nr:hypothetical protein TNCV_3786591 [Trichonephila clavipes]